MMFLRIGLNLMVSASRNYVVKINNVGAVSFRSFKLPVYVPNNAEAACSVLKAAFGDEWLTCIEDIFTLEMINSAKPLTLEDVPPPPPSLQVPFEFDLHLAPAAELSPRQAA